MAIIDLTREDHSYFFGLFQTDGHLQGGTRQRGKATIELAVKDIDLLLQLPHLFDGVKSTVSTRTRTTNFAATYTSATWRMCNLAFRRELELSGVPVGRKSKEVSPPSRQFHQRGYFRGLLDGDGSVGFTRAGLPFIGFVTASSSLADYFCSTVKNITGAERTAKRNARDDIFSLMVASEPASRLAEWAYPQGCLALNRKSTAAAAVAAWVRPQGMRARPVFGRQPWTLEEDTVVASTKVKEAAMLLGRTESAVNVRRWRLRNAATSAPATDGMEQLF